MDSNKWISLFIFRFKILLKANIFFGIYIRIIKPLFRRKHKNYSIPRNISSIFSKNIIQENLLDYFENNEGQKLRLTEITNDFLNNQFLIYNKHVNLDNYSTDKYNFNIKRLETYNRDIRFHWEIYRAKYLVIMGIAYRITNDECYALALVKFITDLNKYSPIINKEVRYNGMEASIKLIYLSLVDLLISDSPNYSATAKGQLIEFIVLHAEYVYKNYNITFYGLESNHGLCCSVGLVYASLLFPDYKNSSTWYKFGIRSLRRALKKQFTEDGVNFESSVNYHRFIFEILIFLLSALYKKNIPIEKGMVKSIQKIGNALMQLTHKNAYISRIGDSDGSKFLPDLHTIENFNNMEYLEWFTKKKKKQYLETIFFNKIPQFENFLSNVSHNGIIGNYISFKNENLSLIISANEIGTLGKGNHQHNDFGAFELYGNKPFIVDPWSYCYTGNADMRNKDRSTFSHNVVSLDNREIVDFNKSDLFEFKGKINIQAEVTNISQGCIEFFVKHAGYHDLLSGGQSVRREFVFDNSLNKIAIRDKLRGCGSHIAKTNMLIPEKYWNLKIEKDRLLFEGSNESFCISSNWDYMEVNKGWSSEMFITRSEAYLVCFKNKYSNNIDLEIIIKNHISSEEF